MENLDSLINPPVYFPSAIPNLKSENPAKWTYERLMAYIKAFENDLDEDHEIGTCLVSFGSSMIFHFNFIGYYGPDIISFEGFDSKGQAVQLIQNISQLNVLLVAVKKQSEKPVRIGFAPDRDDQLPK